MTYEEIKTVILDETRKLPETDPFFRDYIAGKTRGKLETYLELGIITKEQEDDISNEMFNIMLEDAKR